MNKGTRAARCVPVWVQKSGNFEIDFVDKRTNGTRAVLGVPVWVQRSSSFETGFVFREPKEQERCDVYQSGYRKAVVLKLTLPVESQRNKRGVTCTSLGTEKQ